MSFEVFVNFYNNRQDGRVERDLLVRLFPVVEERSDTKLLEVKYDDTNWCDFYLQVVPEEDNFISSLMVDRPCADVRLWEGLFELMVSGQAIFYFPGGEFPLIANEGVKAHIPAEVIEGLGEPKVVRSAREILDVLENS